MAKKLYGVPTLIVLFTALAAFTLYKIYVYANPNFLHNDLPLDLYIYSAAAQDVVAGKALYANAYFDDLPFTYPPFAGVIFQPLASMSTVALNVLAYGTTLAGLLLVYALVMRERGVRLTGGVWLLLLALVAAAPFNEVITAGSFFYGQINVLLMALVALDLLPRKWRLPGVGIGLAAGLKLTPAYMGMVLLAQKRWWAAIGSVLTFAVTVAVGFMVVPDAKDFWTQAMFNSERVGGHWNPGAKAVRSYLSREAGTDSTVLWLLAVAVIVVLTVLALRGARGNRSAAMVIVGLSGCLVSPFSWYHHYVWTLPMALIVLLWVNRQLGGLWGRSWLGAQAAAAVAFVAFVLVSYPYMAPAVWFEGSTAFFDQPGSPVPLLRWLWPGAALAFIVFYAALGVWRRSSRALAATAVASLPPQTVLG